MPKYADHKIKYVETGTWQRDAVINAEGNVAVDWKSVAEPLDVEETSIWCDDCGIRLSGEQDCLDHGLSEEWQSI